MSARAKPMSSGMRFSVDPTELAGRRALVTGGTQGVGEAIVGRLAAAGAKVATTARSEASEGLAADLFVRADVSTVTGVAEVVGAVLERFGGLDILVHNVGGSSAPGGGFAALTDAEWHRELDLNLLSAVRLDRALLPSMLKQGSGAIIHVTSTQRRLPLYEATLAYAAAKAALPDGLARRHPHRPPQSSRRGRRAGRVSRLGSCGLDPRKRIPDRRWHDPDGLNVERSSPLRQISDLRQAAVDDSSIPEM